MGNRVYDKSKTTKGSVQKQHLLISYLTGTNHVPVRRDMSKCFLYIWVMCLKYLLDNVLVSLF